MNSVLEKVTQGFELQIGGVTIYPQIWQAGLIIILLFFLVLTMAQVRRHFMEWSFKGAWFGIFLGFILALILEGLLLVGGRTIVTEVLGWRDAPKPVKTALDAGNDKLREVLGTSYQECP